MRLRDAHILTVDEEVFVSDHRVSTIREGDTWTLQIRWELGYVGPKRRMGAPGNCTKAPVEIDYGRKEREGLQ